MAVKVNLICYWVPNNAYHVFSQVLNVTDDKSELCLIAPIVFAATVSSDDDFPWWLIILLILLIILLLILWLIWVLIPRCCWPCCIGKLGCCKTCCTPGGKYASIEDTLESGESSDFALEGNDDDLECIFLVNHVGERPFWFIQSFNRGRKKKWNG